MKTLYEEMFNDQPNVAACHAGLECGLLGKNYPDMQMISFGPTIRGGKEIAVAVTPEQRKATAFNQIQGFPGGWDLDFPEDDVFQQRMREQMERMLNRMRQFR